MTYEKIVFLGPTLSIEKAKTILPEAMYLPPVKCGDVLAVMRLNPQKIIIIDGYFEKVAAVWHKEILFAMENGIEVIGAASMGALRASELSAYGMKVVGNIAQAYLDDIIIQDDAVAILHAHEDQDFLPLSKAKVDIIFLLVKAFKEGIINEEQQQKLMEITNNSFYPELMINKLLNHDFVDDAFKYWMIENTFSQKEQDAISALNYAKKREITEQKVHCHQSIFFRVLHLNVMCDAFPTYHELLPESEKILFQLKQQNADFKFIQHLAYLMHACFQLAANQSEYDFMPKDILQLHQEDTRYYEHLLIALDRQENDENMSTEQKQKIFKKIAYCWLYLDLQFEALCLQPTTIKIQKFSDDFRANRGLFSVDDFEKWLLLNNLSLENYQSMILSLYQLDFFVYKNNLDMLLKDIKLTPHHWLKLAYDAVNT